MTGAAPSPLSWVGWALPPGSAAQVRPRLLARELADDVLSDVRVTYHHGSTPGAADGRTVRLGPGQLVRRAEVRGAGAVLSPVLLRALGHAARWIDLYDDWALAPDVHPVLRALAAQGCRALRRQGAPGAVVTVNSRYLQARLWPLPTEVVPNGVDPRLADVPLTGDDRPRLLVMGRFLRGRTDPALLRAALDADAVAEVLVVGAEPGGAVDAAARAADPRRVVVLPTTPLVDLASRCGPRTVALVPHLVRDYTMSQDLMKVYQFLALGLPTVVPRALWPPAAPLDHGHLLEVGVSLDDLLRHALRRDPPSAGWRREFAEAHSWRRRADQVRGLLT